MENLIASFLFSLIVSRAILLVLFLTVCSTYDICIFKWTLGIFFNANTYKCKVRIVVLLSKIKAKLTPSLSYGRQITLIRFDDFSCLENKNYGIKKN